MKNLKVKEFMVPISDYATVPENGTLHDAVVALEKAQEDFAPARYPHRAVLVYAKDNKEKIVGKLSMFDILRALEPRYFELGDPSSLSRAGFNPQFLKSLQEQYALWNKPLKDICAKAAGVKVTNIMHKPTKGEFVEQETTLDEAIHLLVMGAHQSLLVTSGESIVGILRVTDVFDKICQLTKECKV